MNMVMRCYNVVIKDEKMGMGLGNRDMDMGVRIGKRQLELKKK